MRSGECDVVSLYILCLSVNGSVCFVCLTVYKQFAVCLGVFDILLLNVMDLFSVAGGALPDRSCMFFQRMCVCCAGDPSECLDAPSICFACVFVCRMLSLHLGV